MRGCASSCSLAHFCCLPSRPARSRSSSCKASAPPRDRSPGRSVRFRTASKPTAAVSLDGRWDVGFGFNRYAVDFGGADDTDAHRVDAVCPLLPVQGGRRRHAGEPRGPRPVLQGRFRRRRRGLVPAGGRRSSTRNSRWPTASRFIPIVGFSLAGESLLVRRRRPRSVAVSDPAVRGARPVALGTERVAAR